MASAKLSTKAVGSIIKLNLNGSPRNLRILHQGKPSSLYDDSCDGTWVCLEDLYSTRTWDGSNNDYKNSDIHAWLNNDFLKLFDPDIQAAIKQVKIPYVNGTGGSAVASGANGLSCKIFLLSGYELGWTKSDNSYFPVDGAKLDYFTAGTSSAANQKRIAKYNGSATIWWTRSPNMDSSNGVWNVNSDGNYNVWNCGNTYGVRPAFVLPSTLLVSDDGTVSTNEPPTAPGSIDVSGVVSGGTATITLTAATDPDGTVTSYRYERSVDGGDFAQFADVNSLTQTDPIDESWGTIAYRACAVDDAGEAGPYVTSEAETINSGWLLIGGPANNLGITAEQFVFAVTIGVSGQSGVQDIHVTVTVDNTVAFDDMVNQGDKVSATVDVRTFGAGQHGIQVLAEKEDYLAAVSSYTFKVPSFALPAGGRTQFLEGPDGETVLPITSSRNVIGPGGLDIQTEVDNIVKAGRGSTGHLEFVDTILGPKSYELARKENTAYTVQLFATASSPSGSSLVCIYAGYTGQVGTYLNAEAEKLTFTVPANAILSIYKFVLDAPLTAEKDPTVNFTALDQPRVLSAATNAGTAATDLNDALNQIMEAFPSWNYYMMTSADGTTTYYIATADRVTADTASITGAYVSNTDPLKWYQNVALAFIDVQNVESLFDSLTPLLLETATTNNSNVAGGNLNQTLVKMIEEFPNHKRYRIQDSAGSNYYVLSSDTITTLDIESSNCVYCKSAGVYYKYETLTFDPTNTFVEVQNLFSTGTQNSDNILESNRLMDCLKKAIERYPTYKYRYKIATSNGKTYYTIGVDAELENGVYLSEALGQVFVGEKDEGWFTMIGSVFVEGTPTFKTS